MWKSLWLYVTRFTKEFLRSAKTETNITIVIALSDQKSTTRTEGCHIIKPFTTTMFRCAYCKEWPHTTAADGQTLAPAFDATTDACCNHKVFPAPAEIYINRLAIYKPGTQNTMTAGKRIQTPLFTDHRFQESGHML